MVMSIHKMTKKNMAAADEVRTFPKGKVELAILSGVVFGKATLLPGWKWSESLKPIVGTESCMAQHTQYHVSGRLHVVMDDGNEDEPVVVIDITGMKEYAKGVRKISIH